MHFSTSSSRRSGFGSESYKSTYSDPSYEEDIILLFTNSGSNEQLPLLLTDSRSEERRPRRSFNISRRIFLKSCRLIRNLLLLRFIYMKTHPKIRISTLITANLIIYISLCFS